MRLIDADELIEHMYLSTEYDKTVDDGMGKTEAMCKAFKCGWNDALASVIDYAPTVDAKPVKHGQWVRLTRGWYCSCCRELVFPKTMESGTDYCPYCGAKMEFKESEE